MTAADQAWIDNSLARLEALHTQRESVEAAGQLDKLAEIDEEIASLTEVLEAVADESGPINVAEPAPAPVAQPMAQPVPQPVAPQPQPMAQAPAQPFAAPAQPFAAPAPAMAPPQAAPMMSVPMDDDVEFKKSKAPLFIAAAVILVGGGVAAALTLGGAKKEEPKAPAAPTETKVITAAEVPEDTQEPVVAKGQDADRTPSMEIKESSAGPAKSSGRSGKRRNGGKRSGKKSDDGRNLDLGKSRDPLAGV